MSAAAETLSTLQAALQLVEEWNYSVHPCRPRDEIVNGRKYKAKTPLTPNGFKDASTNIEIIEKWWQRWPGALIGVPTGRQSKLLVIDIDPAGADWYAQHANELQPGRVHKSRRGHHLLYRNPAVEIRNSTSKIAPGVDVRAEGGYVIWWPAHGLEAVGDLADITEPTPWLLERLRSGDANSDVRGDEQGQHPGVDIAEGGRNAYLSKEAYRLRRQGIQVDQILIVLRGLNAARCVPPLAEDELEQIAQGKARIVPETQDAGRPESLTLEQMLLRFVHVARGPLIVDTTNTYRRLRSVEFTTAYAHNKTMIEKKMFSTTKVWAESEQRMTADCMTFHPGEGQFYTERGLRHLNIWAPPTWPAADPAGAAPLVNHLDYLIPDTRQRNDLLDWLAHAAQHPEVRPHFHFLLIAAQEGTGRSWLVEILRRVWGERHAGETDLHRLLDDSFNSLLSGKVLMAVHEVKAPADERYSHRDRLKSLLTDSSLTVNEKHEPRWTERFCARFLMFTNRDDALPLSETDRRVYVARCADVPKEAAYYTELYRRVDDPKLLAAVWWMLKTRDISAFNPGARAPLNEMKQQLIAAGRTDEQQTAADFAKACPFEVVPAIDLMQLLVPPMDKERPNERKVRMNACSAVLHELGAQVHPRKIWISNCSTRAWVLRRPSFWATATMAALKQEAEKAHLDIATSVFSVDVLIERWAGT